MNIGDDVGTGKGLFFARSGCRSGVIRSLIVVNLLVSEFTDDFSSPA